MNKDLKIPYELRYKFTEPLDLLIAGTRDTTLKEVEKNFREFMEAGEKFQLYLVGDIVTKDFLANSFLNQYIKLCIIDEKTKRKEVKIELGDFFKEIIEFENPAGLISKASWPLLKKIISSNNTTLLRITEGEEDLLVLPLVLELPINSNIKYYTFYGQPPITDAKISIPQGIVVIEVSKKIQKKVRDLIRIMEEV